MADEAPMSDPDEGLDAEQARLEALERISTARKTRTLSLDGLYLASIPDEVFDLKHLRTLSLESNEVTAIPPRIAELADLEVLEVWNNYGCEISPEVGRLQRLVELSIGPGSAIPDSVGHLRSLRRLAIGDNDLGEIPAWLFELHALEYLQLWSNGLRTLPDRWAELPRLRELNLAVNHLRDVPPSLGSLQELTDLDLSSNVLTDLPPSLAGMPHLQHVRLAGNFFDDMPAAVETWRSLETLDFSNASELEGRRTGGGLRSLPRGLVDLPALSVLRLSGNARLGLPPEILGSTDVRGLLEYYFRARDSGRPLNEAKLILLGWGGVGKTSLVNRLVHNRFSEDEARTEGIQVTSWNLRLLDGESARLNVWDFGGQEIMHATHQFFLTSRSLYLLVLTGRSGSADTDAEYWLRLMQSFAPGSPVIVVMNQIRKDPFELDEIGLKHRFPDIRAFVQTDCSTEPDGLGIEKLHEHILRETSQLPDLRVSFPAAWFAIKDWLAAMQENYLTFESFRNVCRTLGETDSEEQEKLAGYLHLLGIALNYRDDSRLRDTHVLNPHWVTEGIYAILNSSLVGAQHGEISTGDLAAVLDVDNYPLERHAFLLDLMRKFELCFPFPDDPDRYLVAELLPKQQPGDIEGYVDDGFEPLRFQYRYPVLPEGLLPRFIVRSNALSSDSPRWRGGCVLRWDGNVALVKAESTDKVVNIAVYGDPDGRRRLLAVIRADFEHIHRSFAFDVESFVPFPRVPGLSVQYEKLVAAEKSGMASFPEYFARQFVDVPVSEMLDGVNLPRQVRPKIRSDLTARRTARVFISYSHKDERYKNTVESHLKVLQRLGLVEIWHDRRIGAGDEWRGAIDRNLEEADIVLLLISADFLASDYCNDVELEIALRRRTEGACQVIPIIVRDCNWNRDPRLRELQALPTDGRAVTTWSNQDTAWRTVSRGIEDVIDAFLS